MNEEYVASPGCQQDSIRHTRRRKMCLKVCMQPNSMFSISVVGMYLTAVILRELAEVRTEL